MPREVKRPESDGVRTAPNLREAIPKVASEIARLDPGPAAALRRGPYDGAGAAAFWKLLAKHDPDVAVHNEAGWAALIQAIAVLTPKGRDPEKKPAHDYSLPMGRALYEAGVSELRLARLLSASPDLRREVAVRTCRRLAAGESNRFNLVTLAETFCSAAIARTAGSPATTTARRPPRSARLKTRRHPQMPDARFLQIHSLHGYSAVLLNRDDSGLAKRITYGDEIRTRISSQCLKRHWRVADSDYALQRIDGTTASVRSRETVTRRVIGPLEGAGHDPGAIKAISTAFQTAVYGDKGDKRSNRQPLLLGEPEIAYLAAEAQKIAEEAEGDATRAEALAKDWTANARENMKGASAGFALI